MSQKRLLWCPQYSNYDVLGKFNLTGDSNWQLVVTKLPYMLKENPELEIDVIVPQSETCNENPRDLLTDAVGEISTHVNLIQVPIARLAPRTRYDFPWDKIKEAVQKKEYTHVYVNDPMHLRHWKSFMFVEWKLSPKFIVQTHFLDTPDDPIVPKEISYWHGTVEANIKADVAMWHCDAMLKQFTDAAKKEYKRSVIKSIKKKSVIWKSGYSINEIRKPINENNIRFDTSLFVDKTVVWVPNRVGGLGKSLDYTNAGKFLFEIVPQLWKTRQDFVVVAGNPNQKITNDEIKELCPAYVKLVDDALTRDEYRWLSSRADVVVALYTTDTNGGLAALEAVEHHAVPLFPDVYEYSTYFDNAGWDQGLRVKRNLGNTANVLDSILTLVKRHDVDLGVARLKLQKFIRSYAAYENTTAGIMKELDLI